MTIVPKLSTQIERLKKIRDDFLIERAKNEAEKKAKQETEEKPRRELSREAEEKAKNEANQEAEEKARTEAEDKKQGCMPRARSYGSVGIRFSPRSAQTSTIVPMEVEPSWGALMRYSTTMDRTTYEEVVIAARWVYEHMVTHPRGVAKCTMRYFQTAQPPPPNMG